MNMLWNTIKPTKHCYGFVYLYVHMLQIKINQGTPGHTTTLIYNRVRDGGYGSLS